MRGLAALEVSRTCALAMPVKGRRGGPQARPGQNWPGCIVLPFCPILEALEPSWLVLHGARPAAERLPATGALLSSAPACRPCFGGRAKAAVALIGIAALRFRFRMRAAVEKAARPCGLDRTPCRRRHRSGHAGLLPRAAGGVWEWRGR